jgi:hypothetical protein
MALIIVFFKTGSGKKFLDPGTAEILEYIIFIEVSTVSKERG